MRKIPFAGSNSRPSVTEGYEVPLSYRGDRYHMYNGNIQQSSLCVKSCVTQEFHISPRFSPTIFDPDANSIFLPAHLCTAAVDSIRRKPCVRHCSREREGLYNGNVQQNPFPSLPGFRLWFLSRCKFSTPSSTSLHSSIDRLYAQNPVFAIVHDESVKSI